MDELETLDGSPDRGPERATDRATDRADFGPQTPYTPTNGTDWRIIALKVRVDSANQAELMTELKNHQAGGCRRLALDLRNNRFLSFVALRFLVDMAQDIAQEGGQLVLIGCTEKTKRHFEIYGSLKNIRIARTESDMRQGRFIL